ncbi:MAG: hypothetical protein OEY49_03770 [Candidatus Heimdallarchaeota archaeon]|nr:hypothetical protein [Candidatus Heimdallarchaeota archaeon]
MTLHDKLSDFSFLSLSASSISALALSIYNWYVARRGAVLKLTENYKFGIFTFQSGRKFFYFPLNVMNNGTKTGMVDKIEYILMKPNGKEIKLKPSRRVEASTINDSNNQFGQLSQKNIIERLPTLPVFCPSQEGIGLLFEFYEDIDENLIIQANEKINGKVKIQYNGFRYDEMEFTFIISEREWAKSGSVITWIDFQ